MKNTSKSHLPSNSKPKLQPLGDRVLIKEIVEKNTDRKTASGIFIPSNVREDQGAKRGEVVAVGPGKYENSEIIPMQLKVGDTVLFQWGDKLTLDGEDYFLVRESEISAIIK